MCEILSWQTKWQPQLKLVQLPLWMCLFQRETLAWVLRRHHFSRRWPFQPRLPEEPLKSWSVISVCFVIIINIVKTIQWIRAKTSFSKGSRTTKRVLCDIQTTKIPLSLNFRLASFYMFFFYYYYSLCKYWLFDYLLFISIWNFEF